MKRSILTAVLVGSLAAMANAQPAPAPSPAPAPDPGEEAYQRGRKHYDLQEWDAAITEFKEAYRIRQDAASLFNIAQSYRLKGDCAQAAAFYKTYRRNFPNEKNIARVDQFITEMDECAKNAPPPTDATTTTTEPAPQPTTPAAPQPVLSVTPPPPESSHGKLSLAGVGIAGAGVACIAGGVLFGLRAQSIEDDIVKLPRWDPDLNEKGERSELAATVLFAVGGAALVGGGALIVLGYRHSEEPAKTSLRVLPRRDGATVSWSGSF
jgi:tetratricopeptide (TPR) repeat protein